MNLHKRESWWPLIGGYLDRLVAEGVLEQWEAGDPDQGDEVAEEHEDVEATPSKVLVHPLPVDPSEDATAVTTRA